MIFSFPFNELAGIGGDYIKQKCVNSGVKMVSDKRVVARAVYFTDNITAELQIKLDDIMKELGMEDLRLQGENT